MKILIQFIPLFLCLCSLGVSNDSSEESRRILALYEAHVDSDDVANETNDIHTYLELPLNHLGMIVDYHDIHVRPLPDWRNYRGIVVWLSGDTILEPAELLSWLVEALRDGKRLLLPNSLVTEPSPGSKPADPALISDFWHAFGFVEGNRTALNKNPLRLFPKDLTPERFAYETPFRPVVTNIPSYHPAPDGGMTPWRVLKRNDGSNESVAAVAVGAHGGWAITRGDILFDRLYSDLIDRFENYRTAWDIDPFKFCEESMGLAGMPRLDPTTIEGLRVGFIHIDADGNANLTHDITPTPRYSIVELYESVLSRYKLPVTFGMIGADFDPKIKMRFLGYDDIAENVLAAPPPDWAKPQDIQAKELLAAARKILDLPYVVSGCHGYSHLFIWSSLRPGYAIEGYTPTFESETAGAIQYLNDNVVPKGKEVTLYQWTGDCLPTPEALRQLDRIGVPNINGGDPVFDGWYDSVSNLSSFGKRVGDYWQIYARSRNENMYTNDWTQNFGGYRNVIQTLEKSESPIRLMPMNIYHHTYAVERKAGLLAVQKVYEWALDQNLCWVTAADYARMAESFIKARMGKTKGGDWWIEGYGQCRTVRFDDEKRYPDVDNSTNVTGFSRRGDTLYISLGEGDRAVIRLSGDRPETPYVHASTGMLRKVESRHHQWSAQVRSWTAGYVEVMSLPPNHQASLIKPDGTSEKVEGRAMSSGALRISLPAMGGDWMEVRIEY